MHDTFNNNLTNLFKAMAKQGVEDILFNESFKNKKCDKIEIKLGINQEKCLYFISMNLLCSKNNIMVHLVLVNACK